MMQYFAIAMTALLVTTKSPKDCEDGYFTGYLFTLSMFSVCVFLTLICYAIRQAYKMTTKYYLKFFVAFLAFNLVLLSLNLSFNISECGSHSVRGFAVGLITIGSVIAFLIFLGIIGLLHLCYGKQYFKKMEMSKDSNEERKLENTYDQANKISKLRDDFYALTFYGYVYITAE